MIYRIIGRDIYISENKCITDKRLNWIAYKMMDELGLHTPSHVNPKAKFYFTEKGWKTVGRAIAKRLRSMDIPFRLIQRKNPLASDCVYSDPYQVALLPNKRR